MKRYLTPAEVAEKCQVSEHTVRRWAREGTIPHQQWGRTIRIPSDFDQRPPDAQAR